MSPLRCWISDLAVTVCLPLADIYTSVASPSCFTPAHGHVQGSYPDAVVVEKPANGNTLLTAMAALGVARTKTIAAAI